MGKVGALIIRVVLDEPNRIYCGPKEPVTGYVSVYYDTSDSRKKREEVPSDLFGPLKLSINFHGRAKTKITTDNSSSTSVHRGRAPLFEIVSEIHDGPYRSAPGEKHWFPFSVCFPPTVDMSHRRIWKEHPKFDQGFSEEVPPSCKTDHIRFNSKFEAFTEFRVETTAIMPGIDIKIMIINEHEGPLVLYEKPRTRPADVDAANDVWRSRLKIRNAELLPQNERPSGFRERFKAMTQSDYFPEYYFEALCTHPQRLYLQEPIRFELRIRPQAELSTAPLWPDLHLKTFAVTLYARTLVRANIHIFSEPESVGDEKVLGFVATEQELPPGPFEKANDMTKTVVTGPLSGGPSSFTTFNIARSYQMQIKFVVAGAGKEFKSERCIPVEVCPPLTVPCLDRTGTASAATMGDEATAGPSSARRNAPEGSDGLPRYEPQIEPPTYEEQKAA
ncbi:hypothetical protein D0862_03741 [Hortaea werneckii]|uniref:Arrestin-like N-terminal domain-containing protein n=1 Tax=Hortaea werneckii TaxID=91943 RepID=A0A3M7H7P3_HORWE|nr:hypothetical protein D0862_03741 [Hortaea werneckii]